LHKVKDCNKGKRGWEWIDLRYNEVDSHFLLKRRKNLRFEDSRRALP
jgi:hypothetical protein